MKKKIISSLLAVAMMMSIAIPSVFAASSDVAGDAKKVSKIVVNDKDGKTQSEFNIEVGKTENFANLIKVYENETKLVLDHNHIRYMLNGNTGSGNTGDFRIDNSKVTAIKAGSTATLTIFDNYNASSKARVTVTLKSIPATNGWTEYAESFTFENSSYVLPYTSADGGSEDRTLTLNAHPSGSVFGNGSTEQANILNQAELAVLPRLAEALGLANATIGAGNAIGGTGTVGKLAITIGVPNVFTVTVVGGTDTEPATVTIGDKVLSFTIGASATDSAAALVAAYNATDKQINGKAYTAAANVGAIAFTAVESFDAVVAPNVAYTGSLTSVTIANTTAGVAIAPAVFSKIVYDFSKAVPLGKGDTITIGGIAGPVVGDSATTVDQQVQLWAANTDNTAVAGVLGKASTVHYDANTNLLTITENAATALAITAAMKSTAFRTVGDSTGLDDATLRAKMENDYNIHGDYSKDGDGNYDYKSIIFTIPKAFLDSTANKNAADVAIKANNGTNSYYQWGTTSRPVVTKEQAKFAPQTGTFTASTNVTPCDVVTAKSFSVAPSIDVKVGQTVEVPVTFYPPNANTNKKAVFEIRSALNTGAPYQYAVISDGAETDSKVTILGVNSNDPGKAVLTGRVQNGQLSSHSTINVKATDYKNEGTEDFTSKIDKNTAEVAVGSLVPVSISNLPAGVTVKWTHKDDGTVALNKNNGNAVVIYGKKIGTNVVTATLSNGEKFDVAVTVKAATAPEKPAPGTGTDVPQTGDSLLANLF